MAKPQKYRDVVKFLRSRGWQHVRTKGSHEMWEGPNGEKQSVPRHGEVSAGVVKQIIDQVPNTPANWK